ncbi:response regulator [Lysobacter alkalisoli]|uniref:Chemotaxis protein CheA n=1 Tax=Marilutibacter alkalisoli TaxID=2591633 RepID=A0A514BTS4_9GAMM|nr:Hpt domain-containing protein [Lysobacter alkalisoli]QDH70808.1 response regulator [Lysobacter alkalisoli]
MTVMSDAIDTTTLGWIKPELDQTLRQAREEIEAFAENRTDTARMRVCASHLHQVHGTLRMVELYAPAMVAEEMERLSLALLHGEIDNCDDACAVLMRGAVQLPDYLERLQGGHRDIPIVLLPLLNELRATRGEVGLNESVLFAPNLDRPLPDSLPLPPEAPAKGDTAPTSHLAALRQALADWPELGGPADPAGLAAAIDGLLADVAIEPLRRMLWVAQSVASAIRDKALPPTRALRQAFSGVEREARQMLEGDDFSGPRSTPAAEPTRQLLYHVAHSDAGHPGLDGLRRTFDLDAQMPSQSEIDHARGSLSGRNRELLDTVSAAIKEDLLRVKDALDLFLRTQQSDVGELAPQVDVLASVADTLGMMGLGMARNVVVQHRDTLQQVVRGQRPADENVLLDVAGALLYVDATLDDQVTRLGHFDEKTEESLLANESRRVLEVVVREAIANFSDARQSFVAFVETNWSHDELADVPRLLAEVSGALRMLDLPLPAEYLVGLRRYTEVELLEKRRVPGGPQLDTMADTLASLEYYLEAVRDQRANRDRILDIARQSLEALGYWPVPDVAAHVVAADVPGAINIDDATREAVSQALAGAMSPEIPVSPGATAGFATAKPVSPAPPAGSIAGEQGGFEQNEDIDDDIREVFLEELSEEMAHLGALLPVWHEEPDNAERMRPIRRVFHTLKGSGRLVGARALGEFSWKIENMLNRVLEGTRPASPAVIALVGQAFEVLPQFHAALEGKAPVSADLAAMQGIADRVAGGEDVFYAPAEVAVEKASPAADIPVVAEAPAAEAPATEAPVETLPPVESAAVESGPPEVQAGVPASVDAVLLEILDAEVTGHLATIESWIGEAQVAQRSANDALQRAIHTLNGAFAMTEVPVITDITAPAEGYIKRLLAAGTPVGPEGVAVLALVADAIRRTLEALKTPSPRIPMFEGLAERVAALRDALPGVQAPALMDDRSGTRVAAGGAGAPAGIDASTSADFSAIDLSRFADQADEAVPGHLARPTDAIEAELAEAARIEAERLETERRAAERLESERLEAERIETEQRLRVAREETERRLQAERLVSERAEAERLEAERLEAERLEAERLEAERLEAERFEAERLEAERLEAERLEAERLEAERLEAERLEAERLEAERLEAERLEAERAEAERLEAERLEAERLEAERAEAERLEAERLEAERLEAEREATAAIEPAAAHMLLAALAIEPDPDEAFDTSELDVELVDIFVEEAGDLLDHSDGLLARLRGMPNDRDVLIGLQRDLHTLKGGARMAGIMAVGELGHVMESLLESVVEGRCVLGRGGVPLLEQGFDRLHAMVTRVGERNAIALPKALIAEFEARSRGETTLEAIADSTAVAPATTAVDDDAPEDVVIEDIAVEDAAIESPSDEATPVEAAVDVPTSPIPAVPETPDVPEMPAIADTTALDTAAIDVPAVEPIAATVPGHALPSLSPPISDAPVPGDDDEISARAPQEQVRIRADLLDRLVNYAGEVAIYRARLEQQLGAFRAAIAEMEQTNIRMRDQLRRLEIETEAQIIARYQREQDDANPAFDPLELDRFSTLQQLSRALSESATDQNSLQQTLDDLTRQYETLLLQQSRVSSELQEGLMRTRMVPIDGLLPRLRRVVRQASGELGKHVQLKLEGSQGELDRNVLERMTAPLEHMLRNAVAHGLETPAERKKAGKPEEGSIRIAVRREGSEVVLEVADDGRGLDREAIRSRGIERGLVADNAILADSELDMLILQPGFSTANEVSRLAGRGVGMDVVASEVHQLGGTLDIHSVPGKGVVFTLRLPQTLAVTQAVFVKIGETAFAVPIASVQGVGRVSRDVLDGDAPSYEYGGEDYAVHDLGQLIGHAPAKAEGHLQMPVLLIRSGDLRAAVCVDQVVGNREIVVKTVGPQVASVPGIFGATIMGDGSVVVILDVAPLVRRRHALPQEAVIEPVPVAETRRVPLVMVVDDSITMRKVSGRVLERQGFEVSTAKDGIDALERMVETVPDLMLLDIEMPRMDGYELATQMKADSRLRDVKIIMITSRTGEKHRQRAMEIGVDRYLGKPYQEPELLRNVYELLGIEQQHD